MGVNLNQSNRGSSRTIQHICLPAKTNPDYRKKKYPNYAKEVKENANIELLIQAANEFNVLETKQSRNCKSCQVVIQPQNKMLRKNQSC